MRASVLVLVLALGPRAHADDLALSAGADVPASHEMREALDAGSSLGLHAGRGPIEVGVDWLRSPGSSDFILVLDRVRAIASVRHAVSLGRVTFAVRAGVGADTWFAYAAPLFHPTTPPQWNTSVFFVAAGAVGAWVGNLGVEAVGAIDVSDQVLADVQLLAVARVRL